MRIKYIVLLVVLALVAVLPAPNRGQAQDEYGQLVRRALSELGTNCANLDQNSACYGFAEASATFAAGAPEARFAAPGDRVDLTYLASLRTLPINVGAGTWGVAVMNVQANVPAGLTGETAVFVLLGDVEVTNAVAPEDALLLGDPVAVTTAAQANILRTPGSDAAILATVPGGTVLQADGVSPDGLWLRVMHEERVAWVAANDIGPGADVSGLPVITQDSLTPMQAFSFRTGGAEPPSLVVPPDVLIVQSPLNTPVDIVANGVPIRVEGVVFLRTLPDGRMQLLTADGEATIYPASPEEGEVVAGTSVIIGGGTWTDWRILNQAEWDEYNSIEIITNVWTYEYTIPVIIEPSGIGEITITVEVRDETIIPTQIREPRYPRVPVTYGEPGTELERLAWEPIQIGCGVCIPDEVFYHSDSDGDWDIYRLNETGTSEALNNISRGNGSQDLQPSYSADGEWVAFTTNRDILGGWEIYLATPDGAQQVRMTYNSANDVNPVWGPANLIAWESNRNGNWELYMTDVSGDGLPVRLTDDPANDINPYWFPDGGCGQPEGGRLVFQSDRDGDWEIYMLDVYTLELTQLTDNDTEDQVPVLSRDGSQMAWVQMNDFGVYDLMIMDLATLESRKLVDMGVDIAGHTFAPDGSFLAFHADVDGDYEVFAVDVQGELLKALTDNASEDRAPSFYCDSEIVVYHTDIAADANNPGQRELYEVNPLPLDGPANFATRLTQAVESDDIYPIADPHEEINSKEGRVPSHP